MSQVLTVPTHFNDIGELSEGFLDRVEQDTLILYGPVAYEGGSEIDFVVLLADGSPALEGKGRVRAAVDGGADRVPETRYDVVVEALQLDGRYEVIFERLVIARQAVSDHPAAQEDEEDEPPTSRMNAAPDDDDPVVEAVELAADETFSLLPDEDAPDTVPPEALDEEDEYDDEPATVIAAVDAEAIMAEAEAEAEAVSEAEAEAVSEAATVSEAASEAVSEAASEAVSEAVSEPEPELVSGEVDAVVEATTSDEDPVVAGADGGFDSEYAFEHGIAAEPQVGMPVPIPSMAAPPEAPPAPPTLRLAEPPEGLTRPSLAQAEESLFTADGEVSDVHTTGLFAYEDGLPIPSRPPLPDPNGPRRAATGEAVDGYDVEESEPPEAIDDEYEEVRLSDFAEAAEEG
jgi:hypothetical protein